MFGTSDLTMMLKKYDGLKGLSRDSSGGFTAKSMENYMHNNELHAKTTVFCIFRTVHEARSMNCS